MIAEKYNRLYQKFAEHYEENHVNPWHEISKEELHEIYRELTSRLVINDDPSFCYFINYIIKNLCGEKDAHTEFLLNDFIPMNFRIFDDEVLVNFPNNLKGCKLISINNIEMKKIFNELDKITTYGTPGKKIYEYEKSLFNRNKLFGLPSLKDFNYLLFKIQRPSGEIISKKFFKNEKYDSYEFFNMEKFLYGDIASYFFKDSCLIYNHRTIQKRFESKIVETIKSLEQEKLQGIKTIIVDLRGNIGGNAKLNNYLINFLKNHSDKKIICLTDYRIFSGGRYALIDLMELGAVTIGGGIATPLNCYGNSAWKEVDGYWFSSSKSYLHPLAKLGASTKEEYKSRVTDELAKPILFAPDILLNENKDDFLKNNDSVLEYAIKYGNQV